LTIFSKRESPRSESQRNFTEGNEGNKVAGSHRTTFFVVFVSFCYKKHFLFASFCYDFGAREATRLRQPAFFPQLRDYDVSKGYGVVGGQPYFGASEFTIFSKHGSPRNGSHHGISFNSP